MVKAFARSNFMKRIASMTAFTIRAKLAFVYIFMTIYTGSKRQAFVFCPRFTIPDFLFMA